MTDRQPKKGQLLQPLSRGPWTSSHITRWCAAQQNWDKIHYDLAYARDVAGLPGTIINGALKQHLIVQCLEEAFPEAWVWRLDYRFAAMDIVGQTLEVRGKVSEVQAVGPHVFVTVDLAIHNLEQGKDTTTGTAIVICTDALDPSRVVGDWASLPADLHLDQSIRAEDPAMPARVREKLGHRLEHVKSDYPIDLSRLRLFAEAIGGLWPIHFDPECPEAKAAGSVLATPLFPLHALEARPGVHVLSTDPEAMGREGVNEVGRHMAGHFGIEIAWNGGNKVEIHSLARLGDRVEAESTLAGAYARVGRVGGRMLFFETLNRYSTTTGRPLVTERQVMICRANEGKGAE